MVYRGWGPSRAGWLILGSAACVAGLNVEACSSPFSNCEAARDCPIVAGSAGQAGSAGSPGQAGSPDAPIGEAGADAGKVDSSGGAAGESGAASEAGAAGQAPTPECTSDADCSDHLACNGSETCKAGACVPGTPPCANPDPAHCDAICKELDGAASCSVRGQDQDKDGHFSSACAALPGDDCNDAVASIHPGVPEVCDGVDHNCNGKLGISEGLPLSGTKVAFGTPGRAFPRGIAWATDKSVFGLVYVDIAASQDADLFFETVSLSGAVALPAAPLNTGRQASGSTVNFIWGGDRFGVSYADAALEHLYFDTLSSTGVEGTLFDLAHSSSFAQSGGLARIAGGSWVVLYSHAESNSYWAQMIPATGVTTSPELSILAQATPASTSLVASGSNFLVGYTPEGSAAAASVWNSSLSSKVPLKIAGAKAVTASGPNGFAIALTPATAGNLPQFYAFGPTGTALCGPVNLVDKDFAPDALVATDKGYLVVSSGVLRAQEVLSNCTLGALFTIDPGPVTDVHIAGGASGYGVIWQDVNQSVPKRRLFGPHFCD